VEDYRDGESALVVGHGGWLQLPSELLSEAGIRSRAHVRATREGLILTNASRSAAAGIARPPSPIPAAAPFARWRPASVELHALSHGYGRGRARQTVLEELTRVFAPGQMNVVTGPSGAGKTTLLKLIAGLERPDRGEVVIDARSMRGFDAEELAAMRRERIGYLPQEPSPVAFLSAEENIVLVLRVRGWEASDAAERAAVVLARVGLADRARQRVSRLSAGETQRVALARALACARGLLIVDEPTSRLDAVNAGIVADMLAGAAVEDRQTVICATHDPEMIRRADERFALGEPG
jgi:putative ABC transport system ATP-binding protein